MAGKPSCDPFVMLLSPFGDGELTPNERTAVEAHLAGCSDCTARVADLRAASGLLRTGLDMAADEVDFAAFTQNVMSKLTPMRPPLLERWRIALSERLTYQRLPMVMAAGVAVVVMLVAVPLLLKGRTPLGYASEQMSVQTVSTEVSAHVAPVVIRADNGDQIIWLVNHDDHDAADQEPPRDQPGVHARGAQDSGQPLPSQKKRQGGEL